MAISKFRSSSHILEIERGRHTRPITPHILEIERGRHTRPITPLENRLCPSCKVVETEIHFLLECPMYECYRKLFSKILSMDSYVKEMLPINKFNYLMTYSDAQILKWVSKFVHLSFIKRVNIMILSISIWGYMHIWLFTNAIDIVSRIHERISIRVCCNAPDFHSGTFVAAIRRCPEVFSGWECGFHWKLCCCWLEGLRRGRVAVIMQGQGIRAHLFIHI